MNKKWERISKEYADKRRAEEKYQTDFTKGEIIWCSIFVLTSIAMAIGTIFFLSWAF